MLPSEELLQSIDIIAQNAAKNGVKIYTAIVTAVGDNDTCSVRVNGKTHSNIAYYGDVPTVNKSYRVFCPNGSMNQAFIITGGGSSGGGSTGATDYNQLTNRPSINGTILSGNQTSSQLGLYGTNNVPPYPVTSVNGQTGNVVISTGGNVDSVNGKTGVVVLNADDVGALPDTTVIPTKTSELTNDSGYITNVALEPYAKTVDIPTKTSQLNNDANYITAAQAPVQSVNNKTGAVTLSATDVSAIPSTLTGTVGQVLTKTADGQEWKDVEIPNDHSKLSNRDAADQHPIGAITGLEAALANIPPTDAFIVTLTQDEAGTYSVDKTFAEIQTAIQSNRTVYLYFQDTGGSYRLPVSYLDENFYVLFNNKTVDSSYVYDLSIFVFDDERVDVRNVLLEKLPNPNALTFTGAVTGIYDGSAPLSVEIPSGGGGETPIDTISEGTLSEDVANIVIDGFSKRTIALSAVPYGSTANSGNIRVSLKFGLDSGDVLTCNPTFQFVTNTASVAWNKIVAFAFMENGIIEVTIYRDGGSISQDIIMNGAPSTNTWLVKSVYIGAQKITSVTIGLQANGVIGKNTAYKVVGS